MTPVRKELTIEELARIFAKLVSLANECGFVVMIGGPVPPKN